MRITQMPKRNHKGQVICGDTKRTKVDCSFCFRIGKNIEGKKYCAFCAENCFRECGQCHLPLPTEHSFYFDSVICNKCFLNNQEKKKRKVTEKVKPEKYLHCHKD